MNHLAKLMVPCNVPQIFAIGSRHQCRGVFKSVYSLDKIYPNRDYDFSASLEQKARENALDQDKFHGFIPTDQLQITVTRSQGPGGQNVNKVNTKVQVRFKVDDADWIPTKLRDLLKTAQKTRITKDGYFLIDSDKTRKQSYNLADCLDKIRFIIRQLEQPVLEMTPEDQQIMEARVRKAASERLREKREESLKKSSRRMDDIRL